MIPNILFCPAEDLGGRIRSGLDVIRVISGFAIDLAHAIFVFVFHSATTPTVCHSLRQNYRCVYDRSVFFVLS